MGPVFALVRIEEIFLRSSFPHICQRSWGTSLGCEYMPRLCSHPRGDRTFLANSLRIGYVPGGSLMIPSAGKRLPTHVLRLGNF